MARERTQFAKDLLEGLNNALACTRGEPTPGTIEHVVMDPDVKAIRRSPRMSQETFAWTYRIRLATLEGWEQRRRHPDATVSAYLRVTEGYPKEVEEALEGDRTRPGSFGEASSPSIPPPGQRRTFYAIRRSDRPHPPNSPNPPRVNRH